MTKIIILDLETTFSFYTKADGKMTSDYGSPFNNTNRCYMAGVYSYVDGKYKSFDTSKPSGLAALKSVVESADVIIGHNIKYDALWLKAMGFDLSKVSYRDTMLREYLIWQGNHQGLGLTDVAPRYGGAPKMDLMGKAFDKGINVSEMPTFIVAKYLYDDVMNTKLVYEGQLRRSELIEQKQYDAFYHEVLKTVIEMEHNGAKFNDNSKESVSADIDEKLFSSMQNLIDLSSKYAKDSDFNPDSPAQLARIIFGLRIKDEHKHEWKGFIARFKPWEQGAQGKLDFMVEKCFNRLEGSLNVKPNVAWLTEKKYLNDGGFSVGSKVIDSMLSSGALTKKQEEYVSAVQSYSKASTWKTSNLFSMFDGVRDDGFVHGSLNMHITSTRRFSSSAPNTQNFPREGTNPVKKLIKSRYEGGHIVAADYGQLEFRIAGMLSEDKLLIKDVAEDMDIHSHTATIAFGSKFTQAEGKERKEMRQTAKGRTFAFQYGAMPKTKIDKAIFDAFYGKYSKLAAWQEKTIAYIGRRQKYVCPYTGAVFAFPEATTYNEHMWTTKAKNYPIQFLSDAINKSALVGIYNRIKGRDDIKLILTVHDSNVLDAAPHAINEAKQILTEEMEGVTKTFEKYFNKALDIPLKVDVSSGPTWFDQE